MSATALTLAAGRPEVDMAVQFLSNKLKLVISKRPTSFLQFNIVTDFSTGYTSPSYLRFYLVCDGLRCRRPPSRLLLAEDQVKFLESKVQQIHKDRKDQPDLLDSQVLRVRPKLRPQLETSERQVLLVCLEYRTRQEQLARARKLYNKVVTVRVRVAQQDIVEQQG
jgi:hypothetical protein